MTMVTLPPPGREVTSTEEVLLQAASRQWIRMVHSDTTLRDVTTNVQVACSSSRLAGC